MNHNTYAMSDSEYILRQFLRKELPDTDIPDQLFEKMLYYTYKNCWNYNMDEEYALRDAVSRALKEDDIFIEDFDYWLA